MSVAEPEPTTAAAVPEEPAAAPKPFRRPLRKRVMHLVRRAHLYLGLFLLPWAVLYGATGFLFNHPTAFADAPTTSFGASALAGTPMEAVPKPAELAGLVVAALNDRAKEGKPYSLVEPEKAKWVRDFCFATVKVDDTEVNVLFDVNNPGGTVRSRAAAPPPRVEEKAPFAIGGANTKGAPNTKGGGRGAGPRGGDRGEGRGGPKGEARAEPMTHGAPGGPLVLAEPLPERVKAAVPVVLERTGFPTGDVTVTSVPDLSFLMSDGAKTWRVTYNALTGAVSGASADSAPPPEELSTRRFLTRLHTAHGYPGGQNAKWFWAVIVDVMAFVMVFWGVSGVFMWWQLKSTRLLGFFLLLASAAAATALGLGMHEFLSPK
ncbi:MAG: PepSY domain-containing protein [Planctomycetes bacterium]|nr:PepSY domain-containing protein [Planctomycetota bacterium]